MSCKKNFFNLYRYLIIPQLLAGCLHRYKNIVRNVCERLSLQTDSPIGRITESVASDHRINKENWFVLIISIFCSNRRARPNDTDSTSHCRGFFFWLKKIDNRQAKNCVASFTSIFAKTKKCHPRANQGLLRHHRSDKTHWLCDSLSRM